MPASSPEPQPQELPATSLRARLNQGERSVPFLGLLDAVLVEAPVPFPFDGSISRQHATQLWTWMARDLGADLFDRRLIEAGTMPVGMLEAAMPQLLGRVRDAVAEAGTSPTADARAKAVVGGEEIWQRLPVVLGALRARALLGKAAAFGRATNATADDAALATALQSMPLHDKAVGGPVMHAMIGDVINPARLVIAATKIAGDAGEGAITRAGLAPLIDAILAHAQNQLHLIDPSGPFADFDRLCRALERFHRLMRAVTGYIVVSRTGRWATVIAGLTKAISDRLERSVRTIGSEVNQSMRRPREGNDRVDSERLLAALNGVYLLATIRDCKDSLAINALFDHAWAQTGETLEFHLTRNLDLVRAHPGDRVACERLEAGIKMAELRFNAEYADVLRRAYESALKH
ncbi:MAG: hypothetical protein JWR75_1947 [Devosia sp.]|nr:hypothetical protein [Devosia sp.]